MAKALPVDIRKTLALITGINDESDKALRIELLVDASLSTAMREAARAAFRSESSNLTVSLQVYGNSHDVGFPIVVAAADLVVILAHRSDMVAELFLAAAKASPVVIVAEDINAFVNAWPADLPIDADRLIAVGEKALGQEGFDLLFENLARWLLASQDDNKLAWAHGLGFVRKVLAEEIISTTSMQNGMIATLVFLPGADLPVLLLNQIRMFFRLAAIYGVEFGEQPLKEIAGLIVQGFVWRSLARKLAKSAPTVSWAVKGTVAYTGTLLLGKLSEVYVEAKRPVLSKSGPTHHPLALANKPDSDR